ncbi:MAG: recombinase family protein [Anaeromicrobium sp.]|jgi:DNA invertase Pin-like site-specific DNA recombinase|uniref:recombinase family protein n=1 Tax=Anaeromicrobium sp. TaxID=1929132 RepID=UPI0026005CC6|nr:recombinase family protein [Anaeromicrobium sp.]MCT4593363.1 recombinase family protein [Anaeromicrobium sp.]
MDRVAIYCRLSDEDDRKLGLFSESIENQKKLLIKYATEKNWSIYKIYIDDDYSGLNDHRPNFIRMIQEGKDGNFDIILCKHQSRFSRNIETIEKYLHNKFIQWNIRFVSVTDNVDTRDKKNKKTRQINSLMNEWYSQDISEAIKATLQVKQRDGKFIGAFAPFGYKKDMNDKNKLIIDGEAAQIVKNIFNLYMEGNSTNGIAKILNKKNILTPSRYKIKCGYNYRKSSQISKWNKTTVKRILRNEVYIGNMVQGKRKKINYKNTKVINIPKENWVVVKNVHESIIDKKHFQLVQKKLDNKSRITKNGKSHILFSKVICGECGGKLTYVKVAEKEYLRCLTERKSTSIRVDMLKKIIIDRINFHLREKIDKDKLFYILNNNDKVKSELRVLEKKYNNFICQLNKININLKRLYMDKVEEKIDEMEFHIIKEEIMADRKNLLAHVKNIQWEIKKNKCEKKNHNIIFNEEIKMLDHFIINELIDYIKIYKIDKENKKQVIEIKWEFKGL